MQLEIKELKEIPNTLYVAVTMKKIKAGVFEQANTSANKQRFSYSVPGFKISIADILSNINVRDAEFLKYVPDGFLDEDQREAKRRALEAENASLREAPDIAKAQLKLTMEKQISRLSGLKGQAVQRRRQETLLLVPVYPFPTKSSTGELQTDVPPPNIPMGLYVCGMAAPHAFSPRMQQILPCVFIASAHFTYRGKYHTIRM